VGIASILCDRSRQSLLFVSQTRTAFVLGGGSCPPRGPPRRTCNPSLFRRLFTLSLDSLPGPVILFFPVGQSIPEVFRFSVTGNARSGFSKAAYFPVDIPEEGCPSPILGSWTLRKPPPWNRPPCVAVLTLPFPKRFFPLFEEFLSQYFFLRFHPLN